MVDISTNSFDWTTARTGRFFDQKDLGSAANSQVDWSTTHIYLVHWFWSTGIAFCLFILPFTCISFCLLFPFPFLCFVFVLSSPQKRKGVTIPPKKCEHPKNHSKKLGLIMPTSWFRTVLTVSCTIVFHLFASFPVLLRVRVFDKLTTQKRRYRH